MDELARSLAALSPLDGRYQEALKGLGEALGEGALMKARVQVEARWLLALAGEPALKGEIGLSAAVRARLEVLSQNVPEAATVAIKKIEATTRHDVKAVEYWMREDLTSHGATAGTLSFLHFACTSEDINNIAYALLWQRARDEFLFPSLKRIMQSLHELATRWAAIPMLGRTHGQTASPTTVGKELAVFGRRLERQYELWRALPVTAKINGAVGNFNAHMVAVPSVDWRSFSRNFLKALGLEPNEFTTQIEPHDNLSEHLDALRRSSQILLDLSRDMWMYISIGYFRQKVVAGEVGSSTMPHKVNPIDFENAEGNLGIAAALSQHLAEKLPVSRWQRDLSDSTVLRNVASVVGYTVLACHSFTKGLSKIDVAPERLEEDLEDAWEVMTEAVQTVLRRAGVVDAYERLKNQSRGRSFGKDDYKTFIDQCAEISSEEKKRLKELSPSTYTGLAKELALSWRPVFKE